MGYTKARGKGFQVEPAEDKRLVEHQKTETRYFRVKDTRPGHEGKVRLTLARQRKGKKAIIVKV